MPKIRVAGTIMTAAAAAVFAAGAAASADGPRIAPALEAAAREGFAASETTAPRVAEPKAASSAGQSGVVITSFIMAGDNTRAAEICGRVTGADSEYAVVRVRVDPRVKNPGIYNALAGRDGAFCVAVVTYTGLADASVKGMDKPLAAAAATAQPGR